jgi:metaxin
LHSTIATSLPSPLISPQFPTDDDVTRIYEAADQALEALAELLGNDNFFFGADEPGRLDVMLFSYVHLMIGHEALKDKWVDTRWMDLGREEKKGRKMLRRHWQAVMVECGWD